MIYTKSFLSIDQIYAGRNSQFTTRPVMIATAKLKNVPISTYSVCFLVLNGLFAASGLSVTLNTDFAAIKKPIAANWLV
jgi:hypothetical protein